MLKLLKDIDSLMRLSKDTVFLMKLLKDIISLNDTRLSAVNLIFDWVITCNDNTWIKYSVSRSVLLIW